MREQYFISRDELGELTFRELPSIGAYDVVCDSEFLGVMDITSEGVGVSLPNVKCQINWFVDVQVSKFILIIPAPVCIDAQMTVSDCLVIDAASMRWYRDFLGAKKFSIKVKENISFCEGVFNFSAASVKELGVVQANRLIVKPDATVNFGLTILKTETTRIKGSFSLSSGILQSSQYQLVSGNFKLTDVAVYGGSLLAESTTVELENTNWQILGSVICKEGSCSKISESIFQVGQFFYLHGVSDIVHAKIQTPRFISSRDLIADRFSLITSESVQLSGQGSLADIYIDSPSVSCRGAIGSSGHFSIKSKMVRLDLEDTTLHGLQLSTDMLYLTGAKTKAGRPIIEDSVLQASTFHVTGQVYCEKTRWTGMNDIGKSHTLDADLELVDSQVILEGQLYEYDKRRMVVSGKSYIKSATFVAHGDVALSESDCVGGTLYHTGTRFEATDSSIKMSGDALLTGAQLSDTPFESGVLFACGDSAISGGPVSVAGHVACLSGSVLAMRDLLLSAGDLSVEGSLRTNAVRADVAKSCFVTGELDAINTTLSAAKNVHFTANAKGAFAGSSSVEAGESLSSFGSLKAEETDFKAQAVLLGHGSDTKLAAVNVSSKSVAIHGALEVKKKSVQVPAKDGDINAAPKFEERGVHFDTSESVDLGGSGNIHGDQLSIKTRRLTTQGGMNVTEFQATGDTWRNRGSISATTLYAGFDVAVINSFFGRIHAADATIHSNMINYGAITATSSYTQAGLININLGHISATNSSTSSLLSFNGLLLPNLPRDWKQAKNMLTSTTYWMGAIRSGVSTFFPIYSKGADAAVAVMSMGMSLKSLVGTIALEIDEDSLEGKAWSFQRLASRVSKTAEKWSALPWHRKLAMGMQVKSAVTQVVGATHGVKKAHDAFNKRPVSSVSTRPVLTDQATLPVEAVTPEATSSTLPAAEAAAPSTAVLASFATRATQAFQAGAPFVGSQLGRFATTCLGSHTDNSLLGVNFATIGVNNSYSGIASMNIGFDAALSSSTVTSWYSSNRGLMAARDINVQSWEAQNSGTMTAWDRVMIAADRVENFGYVGGREAMLMGDSLCNSGKLDFKEAEIRVEELRQTETGSLSVEKLTGTARNASVLGVLNLKEGSDFRVSQRLGLEAGLTATLRGTTLTGGETVLAGSVDATGTRIRGTESLGITDTSDVDAKAGSLLIGATVQQDGTVKLTDSKVFSDARLAFGASSHTNTMRAHVQGRDVSLDGKAAGSDSVVVAENTMDLEKGLDANFTRSIVSGKTTTVNGRVVVAEKSRIGGSDTLTVAASAVVDVSAGGLLDGGAVQQNGTVNLLGSAMTAKGTLHLSVGSRTGIDHALLEARDVVGDGAIDGRESLVKAEQKISLSASAKLSTHNALMEGADIDDAALHDFTGVLVLKASNHLDLRKTSSICSGAVNLDVKHVLKMDASSASFEGKLRAQNGVVVVDHLADAVDFVQGAGRYKDQEFSDSLTVAVNQDLTLRDFQRDADLDVTAKSIDLPGDRPAPRSGSLVEARSTEEFLEALALGRQQQVKVGTLKPDSAKAIHAAKCLEDLARQRLEEAAKRSVSRRVLHLTTTQGGISNSRAIEAKELVLNSAAGILNCGRLLSENTRLTARGGSIENQAGFIYGTNYAELIARDHIRNTASEIRCKGAYGSTRTIYTPAEIRGGSGLPGDVSGVGLRMIAGGKVINDASIIKAIGKALITAMKGFESTARSCEYTKSQKRKKRVCGIPYAMTETKCVRVDVYKPTLASQQTIIECPEGGVHSVGTNFSSLNGTTLFARDDISLRSVKMQERHYKRSSSCFGLRKYEQDERHESVVSNVLHDEAGVTVVHTTKGDIDSRDTIWHGGSDVKVKSDEGSAFFTASQLSHRVTTTRQGFRVRVHALEAVQSVARGDIKGVAKQVTPLAGAVMGAADAQHPLEVAVGAANVAQHGYNTLENPLAAPLGFLSSMTGATVGFTKTKTDHKSQTHAPSGFHKPDANVTLEAGKTISIQNQAFNAANARLKANEVIFRGDELRSSFSHFTSSVSATVSVLSGFGDASVSQSTSKGQVVRCDQQRVHVAGNLHIEAEKMTQDAASIDTGTMTGNVEMHRVISRQGESKFSSSQNSISMHGLFSGSTAQEHSRTVAEASGLHVREGINHDAAHQFTVGHAHITGGYVTTGDGTVNGYAPDVLVAKSLHDERYSSSCGISMNIPAVMNALEGNDDALKSRDYMTVPTGKTNYQAVNRPTVSSGNGGAVLQSTRVIGEVNTDNASMRRVTQDTRFQIALDAPVGFIAQTSQKFRSGVESLTASKPRAEPLEASSGAKESKYASTVVSLVSPESEVLNEAAPDNATLQSPDPASWPNGSADILDVGKEQPKVLDGRKTAVREVLLATFAVEKESAEELSDAFSADLKTMQLWKKPGHGGDPRLFRRKDGQYAELKKEAGQSIEENKTTGSVKVVTRFGEPGGLVSGGAEYDLLEKEFSAQAKLGVDWRNTVFAAGFHSGLGSCKTAVDVGTSEASVSAQAGYAKGKLTADANATAGATVVSAAAEVEARTVSFLGLTFKVKAQGAVGVGAKATAGVGVTVNASKLSVKPRANLGVFAGPGASGSAEVEVGFDSKFVECMSESWKQEIAKDPELERIIQKAKEKHFLLPEESEHLDTAVTNSNARAIIQRNIMKR